MKIIIDVPDLHSPDLARIRDASPALIWHANGKSGVTWKAVETTKVAMVASVKEYKELEPKPAPPSARPLDDRHRIVPVREQGHPGGMRDGSGYIKPDGGMQRLYGGMKPSGRWGSQPIDPG